MMSLHGDTLRHVPARLGTFSSRFKAISVVALLLAAGCSANDALRTGRIAERERNYDKAVISYTRAVQANPRDRDAQLALERAKLRAAQEHFTAGRRLSQRGQFEEALAEFQIAYDLNPGMGDIEEALRESQCNIGGKAIGGKAPPRCRQRRRAPQREHALRLQGLLVCTTKHVSRN